MPPTGVLRERSPASLVGWAKPRPPSGRAFLDEGDAGGGDHDRVSPSSRVAAV
jgi:hypothetical protein